MSSIAGPFERFVRVAERTPERVAMELVPEGRRVTYGELLARAAAAAAFLDARGVGEGTPVMTLLPSGPELVAYLYGGFVRRATVAPLADTVTAFELAGMLRAAMPAVVALATSRAIATLEAALALTSADVVPTVVWLGEGAPPASRLPCVVPPAAGPAAITAARLDPPPPSSIVTCHFTYKGLGRPLGVLHRYSSYAVAVDAMIAHHPGADEGPHLVVLPMHPVYGLVSGLMAPLALGVTLVVSRLGAGAQLLDALVDHQTRVACLVPPLLSTLASAARKRPDLAKRVHARLDLASGGSVLEDSVADAVHASLGREVIQGYGTTETLPVLAGRPGRVVRGTVGLPIRDDVRVAVLDVNGDPLARGARGAIAISGPTLLARYLDDEANTRFVVGGAFRTGDLGHVDEGGHLVFYGRALPFTKSFGQMVDLRELEDVACQFAGVIAARAVASSDERLGECVDLTVRVATPGAFQARDLKAHLRASLSAYKLPRNLAVVGGSS